MPNLILYDGPENAVPATEEIAARKQLEAADSEIEKLTDFINTTVCRMNYEFPDLASAIVDIDKELEKEIAIHKHRHINSDSPTEPKLDVPGLAELSNAVEQQELSKKQKNRLRYLYRRIAQLCHPDKTRDHKMHEFYHTAKELFEAKDLAGLEIIYSYVKDRNQRFKGRKYLEALKQMLAERKARIEYIKNQDYYLMCDDYASGESGKVEKAKSFYCIILNQALIVKRQMLRDMRNKRLAKETSITYSVTW
jgi:hypothetical protein